MVCVNVHSFINEVWQVIVMVRLNYTVLHMVFNKVVAVTVNFHPDHVKSVVVNYTTIQNDVNDRM
jgi:hypothetical protein